MKVKLTLGNDERSIAYPDNAVWISLFSRRDKDNFDVRISNGMELYISDLVLTTETVTSPEGTETELTVYYSDDKDLQSLIKSYKGLTILEYYYRDTKIIATL